MPPKPEHKVKVDLDIDDESLREAIEKFAQRLIILGEQLESFGRELRELATKHLDVLQKEIKIALKK